MGGRNPSLRYIEKELRERGNRVTIISTPSSKEVHDKEWPKNVHFTRFSFTYYFNLLFAKQKLYELLEKIHNMYPIDIVHSCEREFAGVVAADFKKKNKIPYVQWAYDLGYETQKKDILQSRKSPLKYPVLHYMKKAEKKALTNADMITTIGEDITKSLKRRGFSKITFIGNTVDTERFRPGIDTGDLKKELGLEGKKIISSIGRVNQIRGTDLVIRAAAETDDPEIQYVLVGNDKDDFKKHCLELQDELDVKNVTWLSQRSDIPAILNISYAVIIPVRKIAGGIGNALLEAMAVGKPVVQSRVAGAPYVIEDWKNGVLFDDGDYRSAALAVKKLADNPDQAEQIGLAARQTVKENYSVKSITNRLEKIYMRICHSS